MNGGRVSSDEGAAANMRPDAAQVWRREDVRLLKGDAKYIADVVLPRLLHVSFVRSPVAHGVIRSVDSTIAMEARVGARVVTALDAAEWFGPLRAPYVGRGYSPTEYPPIAVEKVRFAGEIVAAVVCEDPSTAEDLAERVFVEYEALPVITSIEQALAPEAVSVHEALSGNVYVDEAGEFGDVDVTRSQASVVLDDVFRTQRLSAAPIECRGTIAAFDRGLGRLTVWTSTAVPHVIRYGLAECLGLEETHVRVIVPEVGGSFGNKTAVYPEDVVVAALAMQLGRPVRWIEGRRENLIASTHGQEERIWLRLSCDLDGRFRSLESDIVVNGGAYSSYPDTPCNEALNCAQSVVGPYRLSHYRYRTRAVATNTCPNGAYRGVARPGANFAMERLIDMVARELRMDPIELRRRNLITPDEMPYRTVTGLERDSGDYASALNAAVSALGYGDQSSRRTSAGRAGGRVGIGVSCFAEEGAWGTPRRIPRQTSAIAGYDGAAIRMDAHGSVTVLISAVSSGQSHETVFAELAARELGVPVARVMVRSGDTDLTPYGHGSTGSRSAVSTGGAVILAARRLKSQLMELASHELGCAVEELAISNGAIQSRKTPSAMVEVGRLARRAYRRIEPLAGDAEPGLEAVAYYDPPAHGVSSFAAHAVALAVDEDTGKVEILKYVVVEDAGQLLDVRVVDGQIHGGVAQGIGKALFEEVVYTEDGQPLTSSLGEYLVPYAPELPEWRVIHACSPSPLTIGGMKGCGESGVIGASAAIGNAIADALDGVVRPNQLPYSPERVWRLANEARAGKGEACGSLGSKEHEWERSADGRSGATMVGFPYEQP